MVKTFEDDTNRDSTRPAAKSSCWISPAEITVEIDDEDSSIALGRIASDLRTGPSDESGEVRGVMEAVEPLGSDGSKSPVQEAVESRLFGGLSEPFRIGRFVVFEQLGMGGMGVVYAAHDPHLDRKIAIKLLRTDRAESYTPGRARLIREAQAMARLNHPNVIAAYEVAEFEGQVYIAMEFVQGMSLRKWLEIPRKSLDSLFDVFEQAGRGLAAAHASGVIHRDFKPDNVLVGDDGRVRVLDFGLAAAKFREVHPNEASASGQGQVFESDHSSKSLTCDGAVMGTPMYMAPEQHQGKPCDARSDQFSFCVALYRALYDQEPFSGSNRDELAREVLAGRLRPPARNSKIPNSIWRVVSRGLARNPEARFPSMSTLLDTLSAARRRSWRLLITGGVVTACFGGWVALYGLGTPEAKTEYGCAKLKNQADAIWSASTRDKLSEKLAFLGYSDRWDALNQEVTAYLSRWHELIDKACVAPSPVETPYLILSCLEWKLQELETLVTLRMSKEPGSAVDKAVEPWIVSFSNLAPVDQCTNDAVLRQIPQPHADPTIREEIQQIRLQLIRGRALRNSGQFVQAENIAGALESRVSDLGYGPVTAELQLFKGESYTHRGAVAEADIAYQKAYAAADRSGHGAVKAQVLAAQVNLIGFHKGEKPDRLAGNYRSLAQDFSSPKLELQFHSARAMALLVVGKFEASVAASRLSIRVATEAKFDLVGARARLGFALVYLGQYEEAQSVMGAALNGLDDRHQDAVMAYGVAGFLYGFLGEQRLCREFMEKSLAVEASLEDRQPHFRGMVLSYMAYLLDGPGKETNKDWLDQQREGMQSLIEIWGRRHPAVARSRYHFGVMLVRRARLEEAAVEFDRARDIWRSYGPKSRALAQIVVGVAWIELERGDTSDALERLERVYPLMMNTQGHACDNAQVKFLLARTLYVVGSELDRAQNLVREAQTILEGLGDGFSTQLDAIRKLRKKLDSK